MATSTGKEKSATSAKIKFFSAYNLPTEKVYTSSGTDIVDKYALVYDKEQSAEVLKVVGKEDIYTPKQEALDGTYLPRMIERYLDGSISEDDYNAFVKKRSWSDIDVSDLPTNFQDVMTLRQDASNYFMSLPVSVRDLFGDNINKFTQELLGGTALSKIQNVLYPNAQKTSKLPEEKAQVSDGEKKGDSK